MAFNVTGGGSACAGAAGSGFPVGLSGSQTGVDYSLVANGVFTGVVVSGTGSAISFGNQTNTAVYTVFGRNTTAGCTGWMNGSANVRVFAAPSITAPPIGMTVVGGSLVTFCVAASGDGLAYQWRRDGTNRLDGGKLS